jgi:hypothetical protein
MANHLRYFLYNTEIHIITGPSSTSGTSDSWCVFEIAIPNTHLSPSVLTLTYKIGSVSMLPFTILFTAP